MVSSFKEAYDRQMQILYFEIHDKVHLASSVKDFKKKKRGKNSPSFSQVVLPTSVCPRFEGGWGLVGHFLCQWDYAASVLKPGHDCVNSSPCPGIGGHGFN